jgi:hypothetical protein
VARQDAATRQMKPKTRTTIKYSRREGTDRDAFARGRQARGRACAMPPADGSVFVTLGSLRQGRFTSLADRVLVGSAAADRRQLAGVSSTA